MRAEWARSREAVVWEPTVQAWGEGRKTLANRPRPDTGGEGSGGTASLALAFARGEGGSDGRGRAVAAGSESAASGVSGAVAASALCRRWVGR